MFRSSLSTAVLATLILKIAAAPSKSDLFVQTSSGPVVGFYNDTAPDVRQFLGIPFAEPPLGDLRFAPPQDKRPNGTIQATKFPPSCMQQFSNGKTVYTEYSQNFLINGGDSEDCLYVSVWTPKSEVIANQQRPLPVFLYIPGGGYTSGGQDSLYKIPDKWIQRTQSHIVVIMKYDSP
jgi:carboxylesterase type B